jgi:hypothetical protein
VTLTSARRRAAPRAGFNHHPASYGPKRGKKQKGRGLVFSNFPKPQPHLEHSALPFLCGSWLTDWWKEAVVYEIAPISFQDSDGDGIGDLTGLISRIDYLRWLGIDAVWLTPIFPSPMLDLGYDIADFCGVDPAFGSLQQFDALVTELHRHGIRLILDFVPNHSSEKHPWFAESRRAIAQSGIGMFGPTLVSTGDRPTTGSAGLVEALGNGMRDRSNISIMLSFPSSPTSTGAIRQYGWQCSTPFAFG